MNLTIKDIAQMANVSQGTVSKVLNNYEGISEKTKKKHFSTGQKYGTILYRDVTVSDR